MALAAFLNAIFNQLFPFGILLLSILPPLILLLGASLGQLANCFAVSFYMVSAQ
jgi:ABC-type methionine transport system permease subunit